MTSTSNHRLVLLKPSYTNKSKIEKEETIFGGSVMAQGRNTSASILTTTIKASQNNFVLI